MLEVLCHLRDEADPVIHGYAQDAWTCERDYTGDNMEHAFAAFVNLRAQHVADLDALRPDEWDRPGCHSEAGAVTDPESHDPPLTP